MDYTSVADLPVWWMTFGFLQTVPYTNWRCQQFRRRTGGWMLLEEGALFPARTSDSRRVARTDRMCELEWIRLSHDKLAETEEKRTYGERKFLNRSLSDGKTSLSHPIPIARALCHGGNPVSAKCVGWWSVLQLDASLRVASPTSIEHSWMFCRSTVKQHSQQRVQKMYMGPKLRPRGRERTELRDHLEDGSSVPTFPRKKQSMFEWLGCDATAALLCSKQWTTCLGYRFRVPKPIKLLEAEELVSLVRHLVDTGMRSRRVGRSALAKGRSSSHTLNDIRKQLCKLCLFANSVMGKSVRRALTLSACRVLGGRRLLCCRAPRPLHISEIPSPAFLGWCLGSPPSPILWTRKSHDFRSESALDAVSSSQSGREGCRLHSLAEAVLTGICGTRLGHAPQRDPRCGRLRPPDLQSRDLRFAPFMSNTHVRSSNEDLGVNQLVALVSPWVLVPRGKAACDISIFLIVQKAFCSHGSVPTNQSI